MYEFIVKRPLGFIIGFIYDLVQNYGLAIILFTIVVKLILLPLNIKSQKAMRKQQKIQPIIAALQTKYANDKEKLQTEMMKVYKENNVSMAGGCLPMLIQMPILIGLYHVIQRPITYIAGVTDWTDKLKKTVEGIRDTVATLHPELLGEYAAPASGDNIVKMGQITLSKWCSALGEHLEWAFNFDFLGLDLSRKPSDAISPLFSGDFSNMSVILLILIPVFAVLTTWLSSKYMQSQNKTAANGNEQAQQMTSSMNVIMPLMTGYFTFILPSGMGLYWITSSVVQFIQQIALNKYFDKKGDDFDVKIPEKNTKKRKKH